MGTAISTTDFKFPNQTALYHGKVRDVYTIKDDTIVMVATDRISAFDVVLPRPIPFKGQVLNQLAANFLEKTAEIVPNWLHAVPDPAVSVGSKAESIPIEIVIRGYLVGHAWREYQAGERQLCGQPMPDGMQENDAFPSPIITPTSKAETGHDQDITESEILNNKLVTTDEWDQLKDYAQKLFARGQQLALAKGLILVDTKYEFGRLGGKIILIDEIHTPDSSRYFYADAYKKYANGDKSKPPKQLSKEFVRSWLMENGFTGQSDQTVPEMSDDFIDLVSERYIELYEKMTGKAFQKADDNDPLKRIEVNVNDYLKEVES